MNINKFKKGDKITRIEPTPVVGDRSYIGDCLMFIGIENACIYYYHSGDENPRMRKLKMVEFANGWDYYKDPMNLIDDKFLEMIDDKVLERYLRKKKINNLDN